MDNEKKESLGQILVRQLIEEMRLSQQIEDMRYEAEKKVLKSLKDEDERRDYLRRLYGK